jgi:ribose transport system permease protein
VVVLFAAFAINTEYFFTRSNLENLLTGVAVLWVLAIGMTFVIISGAIDLSVGATAAFAGIVLAKLLNLGVPGGVAIALTIVAGVAIGGLINGMLIGWLNLSFFVVTLAVLTGLTGVVNLWSDTNSFDVTAPAVQSIALDRLIGIPIPIWIMAAVFLVALFVQQRTYFGRDVYAVGGSIIAARLGGIRTSWTIVAVFAITGACAAIGSILSIGRIGAAAPAVDNNIPLQAIAAVLLGGTSIMGGAGGVGGTALGVLFIGILANGLSLSGVPSFWQQVLTGLILVGAVLGDRIGTARFLRTRLLRRSR